MMKLLQRHRHMRSPIGLDLGECVVKAAQLEHASDAAPVLAAGAAVQRLRPGAPFDLEEALRLRRVLARRGFTGRQVVASVPGKRSLSGVLTLPPRKEGVPLDEIVRTEMAQMHRLEPDGFELDWWELPRPPRVGAGTHAMAVACPHDAADGMLDVLGHAGFDVVALDIEGWAIARANAALLHQTDGIVAAVDLGWDSTTFVLLHEGVVAYERSNFGTGLRQLRKVLGDDHRYPPPVIDYLLTDIGFELKQRGQEGDARLLGPSMTHLHAHFEQVVRELSLALDYAHSQYPQAAVAHVLLLGGGAMIPGAVEHVASKLEEPVCAPCPADLTRGAETLGALARFTPLVPAIGLAQWTAAASDAVGKEAA